MENQVAEAAAQAAPVQPRQKPAPARNAKMENFGRPVRIDDLDYKNGNTPRTRFGRFHVWGYQRFGGKDGAPSMQTVAVVELEDGRITSKRPDSITFLDRAGQEPQPQAGGMAEGVPV